jgi:DNA-binding transcriptional ArsR family regulator
MTPDEYIAAENHLAQNWAATIAFQFRPKRRNRWVKHTEARMTGSRKAIYELLDTPKHASQLMEPTGLQQQSVSYHLRSLEESGLVRSYGSGTKKDPSKWVRVASDD